MKRNWIICHGWVGPDGYALLSWIISFKHYRRCCGGIRILGFYVNWTHKESIAQ